MDISLRTLAVAIETMEFYAKRFPGAKIDGPLAELRKVAFELACKAAVKHWTHGIAYDDEVRSCLRLIEQAERRGFEEGVVKGAIFGKHTKNDDWRKEEKRTYKDCDLKFGAYWIYWKGGGRSVASVGQNADGDYWYAPSNWISGPCFDWSKVQETVLIQENIFERDDQD